MAAIVLGVGDIAVAKRPGDVLRTYALGSCVGVVLVDPKRKAVGMVHIALPDSKTNAERAKEQPGYFANTGIPLLFEKMAALGCRPNGQGLLVKVAGGAKILDLNGTFDIGKKNQLAVRKCLWAAGLVPAGEDVGGTQSRTMEVAVDTGRVVLKSTTGRTWEI